MNDVCFFYCVLTSLVDMIPYSVFLQLITVLKNVKIEIKNFETEPKISFYSIKTSKRIFNFHSYICRCKNSKKILKLKFIPIGNGHRNLF